MISVLMTSSEVSVHIAKQARAKRLSLNLSQIGLSERSGVSYAVIKKFEQTGKISLDSLLKISFILDASEAFLSLFQVDPLMKMTSLEELVSPKMRKRGRR